MTKLSMETHMERGLLSIWSATAPFQAGGTILGVRLFDVELPNQG